MFNTRAKLVCTGVQQHDNGATANPEKTSETVSFETRYNPEDSPEDNTYSRFTPSASATLNITNPDLWGKFQDGKAYYFDITPASSEVSS